MGNEKYGNPELKGKLNPDWYRENIVTVELPYPMRIAWNTSQTVHTVRFNKLGKNALLHALMSVYNYARLQVKNKYGFNESSKFYDTKTLEYLADLGLDILGGTFEFRQSRNSDQLSNHARGIAIDINPTKSQMGTKGNMPDWFVKCFKSAGFTWGGKWKHKDPMHFEL